MNNLIDQDKEPEKNAESIDKKRRSLTKTGVAAPVIMTLASKSALGAGPTRCSVSGMMSGNASHPDEGVCEGCTPGYWKNHPESWPGNPTAGTCSEFSGKSGRCKGDYTGGTVFSNWFITATRSDSDSEPMIDLLMKPQTYWTLHAHAVAALLNSLTLSNFGNTSTDIINWWGDQTLTDEELKNRYAMLNERVCTLGSDDQDRTGNDDDDDDDDDD